MKITHSAISMLLPALLLTLAMSCNSTDKNDPDYIASQNVAIKEFKLRSNAKVMKNLDQVFFSIDNENGVIFNADSLPAGTSVHAIAINVTFAETPDAAEIEMIGGQQREGIVDYKKNPSDTLDFTGRVILTVTTGEIVKSYRLKVNVHKMNPDAFVWNRFDTASLPSRMAAPVAQKTVTYRDDKALCCLQEADGSFTLSLSSALDKNIWEKKEVSLPANPDIRSFTATSSNLYMLDIDGELYKSPYSPGAAPVWESTGLKWISILGNYNDDILGVRKYNGKIYHTVYPSAATDTEADPDFPVKQSSNMAVISSTWSANPAAIIVGGYTENGIISNAIWGFDGMRWAKLGQSDLTARTDASLVAYYTYRQTSSQWVQNEYPCWMLIGGLDKHGARSNSIVVSNDNCLNWQVGSELMNIPSDIPVPAQADAIVASTLRNANLSDGWSLTSSLALTPRKRLQYNIDGVDISWQCPYIYLFGGNTYDSALQNKIYRGVLSRLTFAPLI